LVEAEFLQIGPFLTGHPTFPGGTNVQVVRVVSPDEVEILIWERGVGRTSSSGTSACAAAAAGVRAGVLTPGSIEVRMEGGSFTVTVSTQRSVTLRGPVQPLLVGELTEDFLASLRS
jgi:diaminopimelate epimerase